MAIAERLCFGHSEQHIIKFFILHTVYFPLTYYSVFIFQLFLYSHPQIQSLHCFFFEKVVPSDRTVLCTGVYNVHSNPAPPPLVQRQRTTNCTGIPTLRSKKATQNCVTKSTHMPVLLSSEVMPVILGLKKHGVYNLPPYVQI